MSPGSSVGSSAEQEVVGSIPTWGVLLPHSSMAERPVVNGRVVGSNPTEAAIYCRVDEWQVAWL